MSVGIKMVESGEKRSKEMAKKEQVMVRMEGALRDELQQRADEAERSLSWVIRRILEKYCEGSRVVKA